MLSMLSSPLCLLSESVPGFPSATELVFPASSLPGRELPGVGDLPGGTIPEQASLGTLRNSGSRLSPVDRLRRPFTGTLFDFDGCPIESTRRIHFILLCVPPLSTAGVEVELPGWC